MAIEARELQLRHQEKRPEQSQKLASLRAKYGDAYIPYIEAHMGPISFGELQRRTDEALPYAHPNIRSVLSELMFTGYNLGQMGTTHWDEISTTESDYFALIGAYYGTKAPAGEIMDALSESLLFEQGTVAGEIEYFLREHLEKQQYLNKPLYERYPHDISLPVRRLRARDVTVRREPETNIQRLRNIEAKDTVYEGRQLRIPDQVYWLLKDHYKTATTEILDINDHVFSYGWHGVGKSQQMIPELYAEAEKRGLEIPVKLEGAELHEEDMEKRKKNPSFQGYKLRAAYSQWKDTFGGNTSAYIASLYENVDSEKTKILVFDEVARLAADEISLRRPENPTPQEYAGFLRELSKQNTRIVAIMAYPVEIDPVELQLAISSSTTALSEAGIPAKVYHIEPSYITSEVAEDVFIALGADKELTEFIADPEHTILLHPRAFNALMTWAMKGRLDMSTNFGRRLRSVEDLKWFLTFSVNDEGGEYGEQGIFDPKLSIPHKELRAIYELLGIELTAQQNRKIEYERQDRAHIVIRTFS